MIEPPPEHELKRLYLTERVSALQIARRYHVSHSTVTRWLTAIHVQLRGPKEAAATALRPETKLKPLERELLERMFVRQERSATDVAKALGVGVSRVIDSLEYHGIEYEKRTSKTFLPPDLVKSMHVDGRMSIKRIAAHFGVHHSRVSALLDDLDARKPRSDQPLPRRKVDRFEEVVVGLTMTGKEIKRTVAWLECGHKSPVRSRRLSTLPQDAIFSCRPCGQKESGS
jgi:transposase